MKYEDVEYTRIVTSPSRSASTGESGIDVEGITINTAKSSWDIQVISLPFQIIHNKGYICLFLRNGDSMKITLNVPTHSMKYSLNVIFHVHI